MSTKAKISLFFISIVLVSFIIVYFTPLQYRWIPAIIIAIVIILFLKKTVDKIIDNGKES